MKVKINTLKSMLPDSPFVQEQISEALRHAEKAENFEKNLDLAISVGGYVQKFSRPNFFMYRPILCTLLQDVGEKELQYFATTTDSILDVLAEFTNFKAQFSTSYKNCANELAVQAMHPTELLLVLFCWLQTQIKESREKAVAVAYILNNLKLNNISLTEEKFDSYNKLLTEVNKENF